MSELSLARQRLLKGYQQMSITTTEYCRFIGIESALSKGQSSTWALSHELQTSCKDLRKDLRKMERFEAVTSEGNGSNNIYWSLVS